MVGGEDCLSIASSAAAQYAALSPKEISGSGVLFYLVTFGAKVDVKQRALGGHDHYGYWQAKVKVTRQEAKNYFLNLLKQEIFKAFKTLQLKILVEPCESLRT